MSSRRVVFPKRQDCQSQYSSCNSSSLPSSPQQTRTASSTGVASTTTASTSLSSDFNTPTPKAASSSNPPTPTSATSSFFSAQATAATTSAASSTPVIAAASSTPDAGTIAGSVVGGVVFLLLVLLGILLYLRARKRNRTPPSSEFMNALKAGATPVLRLDSGAEYTPALPEKGHYSPPVPLPFMQNSYYTSPPMESMKFPDDMMVVADSPSGRPSIERPLHPQGFSSHQASDPFVAQHHLSASVGSRRELWGSESEVVLGEMSPVRQSLSRADFGLPRISLDESPTQPLHLSHSPTSLQPLRRQPDV